MTHLAALLRQPFCRALAAALLHFLWQGALVALLLAAANAALQKATARARYAAACAALAVMLLLPAATVWRLSSTGAGPAPVLRAFQSARAPATVPTSNPPSAMGPLATALTPRQLTAAEPWILLAWLAGVCVLSVRFLGGFAVAERLKRRHTSTAPPEWQRRMEEIACRLRVSGPVRLLESGVVRVPTAIGALRPVILLPAGIATGLSAAQLDSLLAHELAHIRRRDCLACLGQALAETLLFYHPAVWWVSHRIRVERELACDDLAVAATGDPAAYARALLELEERRALVPSLVMAANGSRLWDRVQRLFPAAEGETGRSPRWLAAALALGGLLALGAAAQVPELEGSVQRPWRNTAVRPAVMRKSSRDCAGRPVSHPRGDVILVSLLESPPAPTPEKAAASETAASPPSQKTAASGLLTPEQLVAFRMHGVTPAFIDDIRALGYEKASPDALVSLRIHGVTPPFISEMTAVFGKLPLEDYVAFRIHGLTPESCQPLAAMFGKLSAEDAVALKIHGVDPSFVKAFREAGYASLSPDDAVALEMHDVTPGFTRTMQSLGLGNVSIDDLVAFRMHGVTPDYVREIRSLGYAKISADDLTAFRIHDITPKWIEAMNARAGATLDPDELIERRIRGAGEEKP
jgi:beta-lactamase regulating signal transducer with metallopeptidase domain